jgi:hypothetical protein
MQSHDRSANTNKRGSQRFLQAPDVDGGSTACLEMSSPEKMCTGRIRRRHRRPGMISLLGAFCFSTRFTLVINHGVG